MRTIGLVAGFLGSISMQDPGSGRHRFGDEIIVDWSVGHEDGAEVIRKKEYDSPPLFYFHA